MKSLSGFRTGRARNRGWEEKSLGAGAQPSPGEMVCRAEQAHSGQTHESPGRGRFSSRAYVIEIAFADYCFTPSKKWSGGTTTGSIGKTHRWPRIRRLRNRRPVSIGAPGKGVLG